MTWDTHVFPLRTPSGTTARVMINASAVVALKEDRPATAQARPPPNCNPAPMWKLAEDANTVYQRLKAALTATDPVFPP
jgi:hypothetical protein